MQQTQKLSTLTTAILVALFPIKRNGENYGAGDLLEVPTTDAKFLRMARCVREPTASELEHWADMQEDAPSTVPEPAEHINNDVVNDNHDYKQTKSDDDATTEATETVAQVSDEVQTVVVDDTEDTASEATVTDIVETDNPYDGWLKRELNAELDSRGIEHDDKATNEVLEQLLIADDAKG